MFDKIIPDLIKAQKAFKPIPKRGKNYFFKKPDGKPSEYTLFSDVIAEVVPILNANNLFLTQVIRTATDSEARDVLVTKLLHTSGQWLESGISLINKAGTDQGLGSSITYAKRYALISILGLQDDLDDDATEATKEPKSTNTDKPRELKPSSVKHPTPLKNVETKIFNSLEEKPSAKQIEALKKTRMELKLEADVVQKLCREKWQKDVMELNQTEMNLFILQLKKQEKEKTT